MIPAASAPCLPQPGRGCWDTWLKKQASSQVMLWAPQVLLGGSAQALFPPGPEQELLAPG